VTAGKFVYALNLAASSFASFELMTGLINRLVAKDDDLVGGMWCAIATAFVLKEHAPDAIKAGAKRLLATFVSFLLCQTYLFVARPSAIGMAALILLGTLVLIWLNHEEEILLMAITTIVVMVVSILNPQDALRQPLLRMVDTAVGVAVGVAVTWIGTSALALLQRKRPALK
jgi:uncharacterized membrane protein YccC